MTDDKADYHIGEARVHGGRIGRDKLTLLDDDVSLAQAYHEMHRRHFQERVAQSTVEALMYSLRSRRTAALKEPQTQHRIAALSESQLHEVCERLQKLKAEIAKPWSPDEVRRLLEAWMGHHGW
jgi:hypothetical protein